ncbi:hypothetical protein HDR63_02395 [bacterium]|nr:hypothetical protein [bacterium]
MASAFRAARDWRMAPVAERALDTPVAVRDAAADVAARTDDAARAAVVVVGWMAPAALRLAVVDPLPRFVGVMTPVVTAVRVVAVRDVVGADVRVVTGVRVVTAVRVVAARESDVVAVAGARPVVPDVSPRVAVPVAVVDAVPRPPDGVVAALGARVDGAAVTDVFVRRAARAVDASSPVAAGKTVGARHAIKKIKSRFIPSIQGC